jgi:hypothetical protein
MAKPEIYISVDIEADGPIPGEYSMLSLGAAAFVLGDRKPVATFEVNLLPLEGASQDPDTMKWWANQPEAWAHLSQNQQHPVAGMSQFSQWVRALPGKAVVIGYPVTFDFMFVYWYMMKFVGKSPFGMQGLDLKTLAWTKLGGDFKGASKRNMPKRWFNGAPRHDHTALTDAIGQGVLFVNMMTDHDDV